MSDYHSQAHCQFIKDNGLHCGCIALKGNLFCKHHAQDYIPPNESIKVKQPKRYTIDNANQDHLYERNLNADNIYSLRDEIAILQTHLQSLISTHSTLSNLISQKDDRNKINYIKQFNYGLTTQLLLIDRLEKLIKMTKELEFKEKGANELSITLKTVLAQVVYIINQNIQDIELKRLIAEKLYHLGREREDTNKLPVDIIDTHRGLIESKEEGKEERAKEGVEVVNTTIDTQDTPTIAKPLDSTISLDVTLWAMYSHIQLDQESERDVISRERLLRSKQTSRKEVDRKNEIGEGE